MGKSYQGQHSDDADNKDHDDDENRIAGQWAYLGIHCDEEGNEEENATAESHYFFRAQIHAAVKTRIRRRRGRRVVVVVVVVVVTRFSAVECVMVIAIGCL